MELKNYNIPFSFIKKLVCFFLLLQWHVFFGQDNPKPTDTTYSKGKVELNNPTSIVDAYTYDAATNRYILTKTFEGFNINYPIILTPKEYEELVLKDAMRKYFKEKSDAIDGKKEGSEDGKKDLLPRYYVNSGLFETIFGSNTIDIKPTGSVEMDLGIRYTKQDNPAITPRNRAQTNFDFNQRISMSLTGKVGTRLNVNMNYDTQSTFNFQNLFKLEYAPTEDDIIQKIEVGNISMPLTNSLIRGSQSLFGVKGQFQFGRTTVTGVFSEQKSQTRSVTAQGGGTIQNFEIFALEYDTDRHFFLSQYFRNRYDAALREYPFINSRVQITRIEVWVTNRQNRVNNLNNNLRNIIALQDLGEARLSGLNDDQVIGLNPIPGSGFFTQPTDSPPDNGNNLFDPQLIDGGFQQGLLNANIRDIATSDNGFNGITASEGKDFAKLENGRKLLPNEFTYHPQLGYISLQQRLANDEILAVAYQFTVGDQVYQVGEFGTDGIESTVVSGNTEENPVVSNQSLVLKMLKSNLTNVKEPIWDLLMKNIYQIPGGFQLQQEDFRFNVLYTDPSPLNYITPTNLPLPASVADRALLNVFNLDRLNFNNDPLNNGDGFFDFIPGLTIDPQNGRIIFTSVEPFGKYLFDKLDDPNNSSENYFQDYEAEQNPNTSSFNENQQKYVYREMYRTTQAAALQDASKNKFQLRGRFKSSGSNGIPIGAFNVPRGSVVVTAGGRLLQEGIDYTVNYQAGMVQILDPSLQASNTPINVSVENNANFGQQTRRFMGVNVEHKFSDKFVAAATWINMSERPFTVKSNYGQESVNNSIYGLNASYATEVPFLTRMVNKLPNIDTDAPSNFSFRGEVAMLQPGTSKIDRLNGESTIYVDDFEGSQSTIDMRAPLSWFLSTVPRFPESPRPGTAPYEFNSNSTSLDYGYKRAKLSWYTIDPTLYVESPDGVDSDNISLNKTRRIFNGELFPTVDVPVGQTQVINTFDLSYYPQERGPYNYNPAAAATDQLPNPDQNFGGITRAINSTNFEQGNVEYIQFWILDPYQNTNPNPNGAPIYETSQTNTGRIYFNLGEISEDILNDGRKQYENGLPADPNSNFLTNTTTFAKVPSTQSLIYAFDATGDNRAAQDVGYDGFNDANEKTFAPAAFQSKDDPAADNYQYFLAAQGDVLNRYKNYNNIEGNSPVEVTNENRGSTTLPDVEDINRDNTMSDVNAYFEYEFKMEPGMQVGTNYITDEKENVVQNLPNGESIRFRWLQVKIPVKEFTNKVGGISDFRSIRFMRIFMSGFTEPITARFGSLELIRADWRRYDASLQTPTPIVPTDDPLDDQTTFDVLAVNVFENSDRRPIPYVVPPGVVREETQGGNAQQVIRQNEQSLSLRVSGQGLERNDSRAVFKNLNVDMRQFKNLKMFLHAESLPNQDPSRELQDDEMVAFIRIGNDFTDNFYEIALPLKVSPQTARSDVDIWPAQNNLDVATSLLTALKVRALSATPGDLINGIYYKDDVELDPSLAGDPNRAPLRIGIKGNPNFGMIRTLMVGLRNNNTADENNPNQGKVKGEVWFNELRLSNMSNRGGVAAILNMDGNLADFATISATARMSTVGFGGIEEGPNERSRNDSQQYNIVTNLSLGKLLPKKWGINLPFNYSIGEEIITPQFDPFYQDIELSQLLNETADPEQRRNFEQRAEDYTKRKSINFIGVKKERAPEQKQHFYDPENVTLSYSYNEVQRRNFEIQSYLDQTVNTAVDYTFTFQPKTVEPLKKSKFLSKSQYWKLLQDFNFNYLPTNISFSSNINRQYNRQEFRLVDVAGIGLEPLYRRNYMFNYQYGFNYTLTKSLKLNYTGSSQNLVRNYIDENNEPDNSYTVWTDFWNIGTPNTHNQQIILNYDLPVNKLPFLSFVKSNYTYTGSYQWQRASLQLSSVTGDDGNSYDLGNTIQNSGSHRLNTTLNMESFYKYIGLGKKQAAAPKPKTAPKPGQKIVAAANTNNTNPNIFLDGLKSFATSVKNVSINYTQNEGTVLPGFMPSLGFFGSSKPSLPFVFGLQDDVRFEAAKNGWLTNFQDFNQNFTQVTTKTLEMTANMDLFPDLKVDWAANRTYASNFAEQYDVSPDGTYNSRSPYTTGNFSISTIMLKTSFRSSDEFFSAPFNDFRENRIIIANRLAERYYGNNTFGRDAEGFPVGFGKGSQAVLLPSFLAAYTGLATSGAGETAKDISLGAFRNFPIPNWTLKYSGLMRYKFFKDRFKRFSIQHAYRASYTLNQFRSNFDYDKSPNTLDVGGNFQNKVIIGNANLVEQFNPLVRLDFEMKNSFKVLAEMKRDRSLSMSFDNNLLTEVLGVEYVIGFGYRVKDVIISSQLADNPTGIIKSDINIKMDFSYRNSKTIVRYLDYENNQLGNGQNLWSARLTADYSFSKNLTAIFYYDHSFSKPVISTSFPLTNIRTGFTLRYNFGN